jgi:hypothetical protein
MRRIERDFAAQVNWAACKIKSAATRSDSWRMTKFHQKRLKGEARKRTIFCRILSDIFHSNFDRWHDTEVAALCEFTFDCKDIISTDAVKTARRGLKKR